MCARVSVCVLQQVSPLDTKDDVQWQSGGLTPKQKAEISGLRNVICELRNEVLDFKAVLSSGFRGVTDNH